MSKLQVNDIVNKDDDGSVGFSRGAVFTGVATATSFSGDLTGNVTGNVTGNATGLSGTPNLNVGVVTATSLSLGGVTVATAGVGVATESGTVGTGATLIDFRGAGISTVTVSSGIATVNVEGGSGGGFSPINFILS